MSNLERLATADNNLIKFHVPAAHAMDPTEQPHTFTQMEELDNTYTSPRVKFSSNLPTTSPTTRNIPIPEIPTPIVEFEEGE